MINKIHVTEIYNSDLKTVFTSISDHAGFLSGGGLECYLIQPGENNPNGNGAIRKIVSSKLTFEEKIFEFEENQHFAYVITSTTPKKPLKHHKGWLDFKQSGDLVQVDWHSHFEITLPVFGSVIGWFVKNAMSKVFVGKLKYLKARM